MPVRCLAATSRSCRRDAWSKPPRRHQPAIARAPQAARRPRRPGAQRIRAASFDRIAFRPRPSVPQLLLRHRPLVVPDPEVAPALAPSRTPGLKPALPARRPAPLVEPGAVLRIFARCAGGAWRLHVDASSLRSGAPHRSSTQSFGLYAISRSAARSTTSLSVSVQGEPSLRVYANLRAESSDASTLSSSAFTSATLFPGHRVAVGPPRDAIRKTAHHVDRDQQTQIARRRREIFPRAGRLEDRRAVRHGRFALPAGLELAPVLDRGHARLHLLFERRDRLLHRAHRIERRRRHHVIHPVVERFDREPDCSSEKSPYCECFAISSLVRRRKLPLRR